MKKTLISVLLTISYISFLTYATAKATPKPSATTTNQATATLTPVVTTDTTPASPNIDAASYILIDVNSGKILAQKNMNEVRDPASLTKMMTLYLTFEAIKNNTIKLDNKVLISKEAWQTGGSKMFIKVNTYVSVEDLIRGVIVDSGNDAAIQLAQYVGGSVNSFVDTMNVEAKKLGMSNTHFSDPTGLPEPDHVTSAYDLSLLARAIIINFPQEYSYFSEKWFTYSGIRQPNRNRLLWRYPGADGLKTGHTAAAGYCLVASAKKDNMRLLSVVLGASSDEARSSDSIALLRYGFRFYQTQKIYHADQVINHIRVWGGKDKELPVGLDKDFYLTLSRGQFNSAMVTVATDHDIKAPIKKGQHLGDINVTLNGKIVDTIPLVSLKANSKGGIFRQLVDTISYKTNSWFHKNKSEPTTIPVTSVIKAQSVTTAATTESTQQ